MSGKMFVTYELFLTTITGEGTGSAVAVEMFSEMLLRIETRIIVYNV